MTAQEILCTGMVLVTFYSGVQQTQKPSHLSTTLQAVDRVGRTARRSMDTHIRNVFSQPRTCTSIRRLSALFAFSANPRKLRCPHQLTLAHLTTYRSGYR
jgi:hypothetical protein